MVIPLMCSGQVINNSFYQKRARANQREREREMGERLVDEEKEKERGVAKKRNTE